MPGRLAERLALSILAEDFSTPEYTCLWRNRFLDSERIEIRRMGIIADIDVWDVRADAPERFIEAKAQKVVGETAKPVFHLSGAEWRSYQKAEATGIAYEVWLFQYQDVDDFKSAPHKVKLIVFDQLLKDWLEPEGYLVTPPSSAGRRRKLAKTSMA